MSIDVPVERPTEAEPLPPIGTYQFDAVTDPGGYEPVTVKLRLSTAEADHQPGPVDWDGSVG